MTTKTLKNYCVTYRKDEFVRVIFKCDETLNPMNNPDDYDYITEQVARETLVGYEEFADGPYVSEQSIEIEDWSQGDDASVVISRNGITRYFDYLESKKGEDEVTQTSA